MAHVADTDAARARLSMRRRICFVVASPMTAAAFLEGHMRALARDYEVDLACSPPGSGPGAAAAPACAALRPVPIRREVSPLRDMLALLRLVRLFRARRYDAVHSVTPKAGLLAALAGFIAGIPVRVHTFTGQVWATRTGPVRWLLLSADRVLAALATHLLVDSPSQREFLIANRVVSARKSCVLGKGSISGVDAARFKPDAAARQRLRRELDIAEAEPVFVYVGRLNRDKGLLDLAAAFARLSAGVRTARLVVVGPDEQGMRAKMEAVLGVAGAHVRFVPYTAAPEGYLAAGDVFCLPSYREGFGTTVIEAAATGIPAIGSRIYGISDAIDDGVTGLLFRPGDVAALAGCMERLAADARERGAMGQRARERALRDFSAELVTGALLRFYAALLGPPRG
jgi:glycosyltransferase involved in cell wall biosynthesis